MPIKQVLVYRSDLKMRKGKIAAQCAHGSMKVFFDMMYLENNGQVLKYIIDLDGRSEMDMNISSWMNSGFKKVVLSCKDEKDLNDIYQRAKSMGLPVARIVDAGKTEFHGVPTKTVVAIGPADSTLIDKITGPEGAVECKLA